MKKLLSLSLFILMMIYLLPFAYQTGQGLEPALKPSEEEIVKPTTGEESVATQEALVPQTPASKEPTSQPSQSTLRKVSVRIDNVVQQLDLESYIAGVVAAEMPATFEIEALKAQATAARTYAVYKRTALERGGKAEESHKGAMLCDDFSHCKAYLNIDTEKNELWQSKAEEYSEKIKAAVAASSGEIITYKEEPIVAVFHSVSSEKTENAKDVWGSDTPYLVSVSSPGGEDSKKFKETREITFDDFKKKVLARFPTIKLETNPKQWFKASSRSEAGGVLEVGLGNMRVKGSVVRDIFSLNSTNFTVEFKENSLVFHTTGYGHGVGMSQYGANSLAKSGKSYIEILQLYYKNTKIMKIY